MFIFGMIILIISLLILAISKLTSSKLRKLSEDDTDDINYLIGSFSSVIKIFSFVLSIAGLVLIFLSYKL